MSSHKFEQNMESKTVFSDLEKQYVDREDIQNSHSNIDLTSQLLSEMDQYIFEMLMSSLDFEGREQGLSNGAEPLPGTCQWLFSLGEFRKWTQQSVHHKDISLLWIKGKPGSGKSTLMKATIGWAASNWPQESIVSHFFISRTTSLQGSELGFYRSLTYQFNDICPRLRRSFIENFRNKVTGDFVKEWDTSELRDFLSDSVQHVQGVNIFVDALDEIISKEEEEVFRSISVFLQQLSQDAYVLDHVVRVCVSCRHFPTVRVSRKYLKVSIEAHSAKDIELYIKTKLFVRNDSHKENIQYELLHRAAGVFLWVVVVVDMLNEAYYDGSSSADIEKRLTSIPSELGYLYTMTFDFAVGAREEHLLLFQWLLFQFRNLSPVELYLMSQPRMVESNSDWEVDLSLTRIKQYVSAAAGGLLQVTEKKLPTVQFIHGTVRGFLLSEGLSRFNSGLSANAEGMSHSDLAQCCLRLLTAFSSSSLNRDDVYGLLEYVVDYMFLHAETAEKYGVSQELFLAEFHSEDRTILQSWIELHNTPQYERLKKYATDITLLHILADYGLVRLIETALRLGADVNAQSGEHGAPLQFACDKGHLTLVKLLLGFGADVNVQGGKRGNALQTACYREYGDIVSLLIQSGANVNARGGLDETALQAACWRGNTGIGKLLLQHGADVHAQGHFDETALTKACSGGHTKVAELLLENGANVNSQDKYYGTALQAVCFSSSNILELVELLLDNGADIEARQGEFGTPLQVACYYKLDNYEIVKLLIDRGVDVNAQTEVLGTALQAVCARRYEKIEIVRLLLDHGADVNAEGGGDYGTALQAASHMGHTATVRLLLESGADVNR